MEEEQGDGRRKEQGALFTTATPVGTSAAIAVPAIMAQRHDASDRKIQGQRKEQGGAEPIGKRTGPKEVKRTALFSG